MFIREFFMISRIIDRGELGIDPYAAAAFVLQRGLCAQQNNAHKGQGHLGAFTLQPFFLFEKDQAISYDRDA